MGHYLMGTVSLGVSERILGMDGDDGCTTMLMYLMSLNGMLKNG